MTGSGDADTLNLSQNGTSKIPINNDGLNPFSPNRENLRLSNESENP
jgi:hypothetical protein